MTRKTGRKDGDGRPGAGAQATAPVSAASGAPPSNRAPQKYTEGEKGPCRILRWGIDTLDLSYRGEISDTMLGRLSDLKETAKSEEEQIQATAQIQIGEHLFSVMAHGQGRFRFVLTDRYFFIAVSKGKKLPLAYAQISSEYLTSAGIDAAVADLRYVVNSLGRVDGQEHVSRADLCVDFVPHFPVESLTVYQWITRARNKAAYWSMGDRFSGWRIGTGGAVQSRFYDKVLEIIEESHKTYLLALWRERGWKDGEPVWRKEFQVGRPAFRESGIDSVADLLANLGAVWEYLVRDWLRLAVPVATDTNRSRWPNHPLWNALATVNWSELPQPTLKRVRPSGAPRDENLFTGFPGYIASLMAREGITDWSEGLGEALRQAEVFHKSLGRSLARYVEQKARVKGRRLSTINNREKNVQDRERIVREAEEYRRVKDGDLVEGEGSDG